MKRKLCLLMAVCLLLAGLGLTGAVPGTVLAGGGLDEDALFGDINGDGLVDVDDILDVRRHMFGLADLEGAMQDAALLLTPGGIDIDTILAIRRIMFGMDSTPGETEKPAPSPTPLVDAQTSAQLAGLYMGITPDKAVEALGAPARDIAFTDTVKWVLFHNAAYSDFVMVRFNAGVADAIFSMSKTWKDTALWVADVAAENGYACQIFTDKNDDFLEYGCAIYATSGNAIDATQDYGNQGAVEWLIFELTNAFRGIHGVAPLTWDDTAAATAKAHGVDMATNNYFDHKSLDGRTPSDRMTNAGINWHFCGENIAAGQANAIKAVNGWINSSSHRAAMINPDFTRLGVGYATRTGTDYTRYFVQNFFTPF